MAALSDPRVLTGHRINRQRTYCGLKLNEEGLNCWNAYSMQVDGGRLATGQQIAEDDQVVNKPVTSNMVMEIILTMQRAHQSWRPEGED